MSAEGGDRVTRLTEQDWQAIASALARCLADEFEDESEGHAMLAAQQKVWERLR